MDRLAEGSGRWVLRPHLAASAANGLLRHFIRVREPMARELGVKRMVTDATDNIASVNSLIACRYRLYEPEGAWGFSQPLYWQKDLV